MSHLYTFFYLSITFAPIVTNYAVVYRALAFPSNSEGLSHYITIIRD